MRKRFEKFIEENMDGAYRFALLYAKNPHDAQDILSESVLRALSSLSTLKEPSKLKSWFYKIIVNTAHTYMHKEKREAAYLSEISIAEQTENGCFCGELSDLLKVLSPKQRTLIALRFFEDMKLCDIADVLGMNLNTVKTELYRTLEILRKEYEKE